MASLNSVAPTPTILGLSAIAAESTKNVASGHFDDDNVYHYSGSETIRGSGRYDTPVEDRFVSAVPTGTEQHGTQASQEDENFEINDDDDDYGAVDRLSPASDGSANFEAETEKEILAAGEHGIDWDDERTYGYADASNSEYFLPPQGDVNDFMTLRYEDFLPSASFTPNLGPAIAEANPGFVPQTEFVPQSFATNMSWSMSGSSDSVPSEQSSDPASRRVSFETGEPMVTQLNFTIKNGDETDDDEEFPPPASATGNSAGRNGKKYSSPQGRLITESTPRKVGLKRPVLRKIKLNPNKAVAFYVGGPTIMRFMTPKDSTLTWINVSTFDDSDDSAADSPTMIDLDVALADGNTRTGAAVTDAIHGVMFRQHHCDPENFVDANQASSSGLTEFERVPHMNAVRRQLFHDFADGAFEMFENAMLADEQAALELIDFDGGVVSLETSETSQTMAAAPSPENTEIDDDASATEGSQSGYDSDETSTPSEGSQSGDDTPTNLQSDDEEDADDATTPTSSMTGLGMGKYAKLSPAKSVPSSEIEMESDEFSPLKKRAHGADDAEADDESASPAPKRQRH